jgi:hypothetical protein
MKAPVTKFFLLAGFWLTGIATTTFFASLIYAVLAPKRAWPEFLTSPAYGWVMGVAFMTGLGLSVLSLGWLFIRWIWTLSPSKRLLAIGLSLLAVTAGVTFLACSFLGGLNPYTFGYFIEILAMSGLFIIPLVGVVLGAALTVAGLLTLAAQRRTDR